ncbi:GntR family transcriptional regulator [Sphingosinithalassobacter portus]|uniref:GntR family transcriptional regulator n=1 Tax=Stakelama portus TaxID=2676234 RepID=UPI000D6DCBEB|nr:FCD domain-containing protein [Sphingosinithalassobacter portus]
MLQIRDIPDLDRDGPRSQTTMAYEVIRSDILNGRHVPEKKLKIQELAEELEVSPGAVREALSRLVPEQLVVSRDQRGFAVAPLSIADLQDLTDLRCEIEAVALRRSVEHGDVDWEAGILAAEHRLRGEPVIVGDTEPKLNPEWVTRHAAFHQALVSACGSRRLLALHNQLYEQSERYRGLSLHIDAERNVPDEHHAIVELALAREADRLVDVTVEHLRRTTNLIVEAARQSEPAAAAG